MYANLRDQSILLVSEVLWFMLFTLMMSSVSMNFLVTQRHFIIGINTAECDSL
jgi:hypothetical protein